MLAKKILLSLLLLVLILGLSPVFAQTASNPTSTPTIVNQLVKPVGQLDNLTQITAQDFGNIKTGWFNNLWRDIRIFFTFDPINKANLETEKATAILLDTEQDLAKKKMSPEKLQEKLEAANQKYGKIMEKVKAQLEKYKKEHPKADSDERLNKFLDKFTNFTLKHQLVFQALEEKTPAQVKELLERNRQKHLERFAQIMEKVGGQSGLNKHLKKELLNKQNKFEHRVMQVKFLDKLENNPRLDEETKNKIKALKDEIKPVWDDLLQTYQQAVEKRQQTIEELKKEAEENKDKLLNDPQARHEFVQKVNQQMKAVREENQQLYQAKRQTVNQFIQEHQAELLDIKSNLAPVVKPRSKTHPPVNPVKNRPHMPLMEK